MPGTAAGRRQIALGIIGTMLAGAAIASARPAYAATCYYQPLGYDTAPAYYRPPIPAYGYGTTGDTGRQNPAASLRRGLGNAKRFLAEIRRKAMRYQLVAASGLLVLSAARMHRNCRLPAGAHTPGTGVVCAVKAGDQQNL